MIEGADLPLRIFSEGDMRHLLSREVQRCTRYQDYLSVCLVRTTPSGRGPAGPARRIAEMLRATDFVGIMGADIIVLLVHTPGTDAALITGRIRDRVQADDPGEAGGLRIALASFPTDATSDEGLLAHAGAQLQATRPG